MLREIVKEIKKNELKTISDTIKLKLLIDRKIAKAKLTPSQALLLSIQEKEHLSIKQLANFIGIPVVTTRKILLGFTKDPQIRTFNRILLAYSKVLISQQNFNIPN